MAYNFPDAPTEGLEFDTGDAVYTYTNGAWDLKSGAITDYVLKAGDTMSGALTVGADPAKGSIALRLPNGAEPGHIAFMNADGTRKAYLGAGAGTNLDLNMDNATSLAFGGGNFSFGTALGANQDDLSKHIEMYSGANGLGMNTTTGGQFNFVCKHNDHAFNFRTGTVNRAIINKDGLGPRSNINVVWQNGFAGTCQFRVNPAMVTLMMHDVTKSVAETGGSVTSFKMFDYPAGVPAPWANLSEHVPLYTNNAWGHAGRYVIIRAQTNGVFMQLYEGGANVDYNAGDRISFTMTWSR